MTVPARPRELGFIVAERGVVELVDLDHPVPRPPFHNAIYCMCVVASATWVSVVFTGARVWFYG